MLSSWHCFRWCFGLNITVVLKMLLVVAIVVQSLGAVASETSDNHHIDIEHLQTEHDHQDDFDDIDENAEDEKHDIKDCHHCGHCSGSHISWVLFSDEISTVKLHNIIKVPHKFDLTKEFLEAILRPPIA